MKKSKARERTEIAARIILDQLRACALEGAAAPSHEDMQDAIAAQGLMVEREKIRDVIGHLKTDGRIKVETRSDRERRYFVTDADVWTDWTSQSTRRRGTTEGRQRPCIVPRCGTLFVSTGAGHRMCDPCRSHVETSPFDMPATRSGFRVEALRA